VIRTQPEETDYVEVDYEPCGPTARVRFRRFANDEDFASLSDICIRSWKADDVEFIKTAEDFRSAYEHDPNRDPAVEILIAELEGRPIAFAETCLMKKSKKELRCFQYVHILPEFRQKGLREALVRQNEMTLRELVRERPGTEEKVFQSWALSAPNDWRSVLLAEGYEPIWHLYEMRRPNMDDIPEAPLPEGVTVRPIREEDYRKVWDATREMFIDQPWTNDDTWSEGRYQQWLASPTFRPDLWQIAWDGDRVVGSVQSYIDDAENETFGKRRGHTETIFVSESWRGKGLAKALIARSLRLLKEKGMEEAMLDTEEANVHEAYKVYEKIGFRVVNQFTFFQKPL
jgi:mycothiol synthase